MLNNAWISDYALPRVILPDDPVGEHYFQNDQLYFQNDPYEDIYSIFWEAYFRSEQTT